jgi:carbon monoxide dehydrogenase subunit G
VRQELTEEVPAPPEEVRAFYADLDNIAKVHPLIVAVRRLDRTPTVDGYRQDYRITDRIPFGPFSFRTSYRVRMSVPASGDLTAEAHQFPRVRLRTAVTFAPTSAGTRITEHIAIEAPRLLAAVTARKAVAAHREMLVGMRRLFGG